MAKKPNNTGLWHHALTRIDMRRARKPPEPKPEAQVPVFKFPWEKETAS